MSDRKIHDLSIADEDLKVIIEGLTLLCSIKPQHTALKTTLEEYRAFEEIEDINEFESVVEDNVADAFVRNDKKGISVGMPVQVIVKSNGRKNVWSDWKYISRIRRWDDGSHKYEVNHVFYEREQIRTKKEEDNDYKLKIEDAKFKKTAYVNSRKSGVSLKDYHI